MVTTLLIFSAWLALLLCALEVLALRFHLSRPARRAASLPPARVSVLKPLCGWEADLEANVRSMCRQDYGDFELLLGVKDRADAAYPLALHLAETEPHVRVCLQEEEVGLNPKVNQLATLVRRSTGPVLVISDSNVRVPQTYLSEMVAPLEDPEVGMVTSPIAAVADRTLGGTLDALHLHTFIGPSVAGSKVLARQNLFIGKSMAFRRADLEQVGGMRTFANLLAEDHALGRAMVHLGRKAVLARTPITNVTHVTVKQFFDRYARWGLMQRWIAGPGYPAQILTFPVVLALAAAFSAPRRPEVGLLAASIVLCKLGLDSVSIHALSGRWPRVAEVLLIPVKDLIVFAAFIRAFLGNQVVWRGHALRVGPGSELSLCEAA